MRALTGFLFFLVLACGASALCHWVIRIRWVATGLAVILTLGSLFVSVWNQLDPITPVKIGMLVIVALLAFIPAYLVDLLFARMRPDRMDQTSGTSSDPFSRPGVRVAEIVLRHGLAGFFVLSCVVAYRGQSWIALAFHLAAFMLVSLPRKSAPGLRLACKVVFSCVLWMSGTVLQMAILGEEKPGNAPQPRALSATEPGR